MGLEGAGKFQKASSVLQSGIWQELKVPRAPQDLQVGMLVRSSPGGVVSITSGSREPSEGLPKLGHPQEKAWKGEKLLFQAPSAPSRPGPEEFAGRMQFCVSRSAQAHSKGVFLSSHPLCSVLRAGLGFTGISPSCSCFCPSLTHIQAFPGGRTCSECPIFV